jgi:hypothetical protein
VLGTTSATRSQSCTACSAGELCHHNSVGAPTQSICPAGFYCTSTISGLTITACSGGQRLLTRGGSASGNCQDCTAGYYCPPGTPYELLCPPGGVCSLASEYPQTCGVGFYQPYWKKSVLGTPGVSGDCVACPAGYFCPDGAAYPVKCPAGYACETADNALNGVVGATTTLGTLKPCPAGEYSGGNSLTAEADCKPCWAGHYCVQGSIFPTPCPAGTHTAGVSGTALTS